MGFKNSAEYTIRPGFFKYQMHTFQPREENGKWQLCAGGTRPQKGGKNNHFAQRGIIIKVWWLSKCQCQQQQSVGFSLEAFS